MIANQFELTEVKFRNYITVIVLSSLLLNTTRNIYKFKHKYTYTLNSERCRYEEFASDVILHRIVSVYHIFAYSSECVAYDCSPLLYICIIYMLVRLFCRWKSVGFIAVHCLIRLKWVTLSNIRSSFHFIFKQAYTNVQQYTNI